MRTQIWLRYYNSERSHTQLGYRVPQQYFEDTASVCADPLGALPPNPQDLSQKADPENKEAETRTKAASRPSVFGPATTLVQDS